MVSITTSESPASVRPDLKISRREVETLLGGCGMVCSGISGTVKILLGEDDVLGNWSEGVTTTLIEQITGLWVGFCPGPFVGFLVLLPSKGLEELCTGSPNPPGGGEGRTSLGIKGLGMEK